ncbi:hypothetical protein ACFQ3Z_00555 [Streptomyces nogalater]
MPPIDELLLAMGEPFPEPGWLPAAYSLLSQVTHSTPTGLAHMARYVDGTLRAHDISPRCWPWPSTSPAWAAPGSSACRTCF